MGIVAFMLGAMMFCIGAYFMMGPLMLMQAHLLGQLYEVYLSRGGVPIKLKGTEVVAKAAVSDGDES